ncbi:hypothetical protein [Erinnyis ello granulovirus]|uniref:Uncharacterized protein n=1 Tax=Erinnyis ello granulovirus TaxID=307444 RepID=A0A097DAP3_9BBAC|nr:hypothetical protein [Erinnyis ello granulovirus]AIS92091.1 hypothetical protein [Erinnyis ello granulovirus]ARX71431.1 hypothetical protein EREL_092 [Erinnyis ello granulovirus]ARX71561.1 hypothetical protein EREL_092 [Erinnyis ello granulovirus]ARX71691.1 hypothetical protein EREL_092 [Erinnyis ello granulovirus]ARX71821.1 hypothetical protein EREL_092 [Erinnyis ello granulovirus]
MLTNNSVLKRLVYIIRIFIMNNHHTFASDHNYNHNYYDSKYSQLEKVQKEILQQHKYLESELNHLRDNITSICRNGNGVNCVGLDSVVSNAPLHRRHTLYPDTLPTTKHYDLINGYHNYKVRKF